MDLSIFSNQQSGLISKYQNRWSPRLAITGAPRSSVRSSCYCLILISFWSDIILQKMAEAHSAVAFSFNVTPEGVNVHVNHEAIWAVWYSGVRSWKKRIGRLKVSYWLLLLVDWFIGTISNLFSYLVLFREIHIDIYFLLQSTLINLMRCVGSPHCGENATNVIS